MDVSGHFHGEYCVPVGQARVAFACLEAQYELEIAEHAAYSNLMPGDFQSELEKAGRESAVILSNAQKALRSSGENAGEDLSWLESHRKWALAYVAEVQHARNLPNTFPHWFSLLATRDLACRHANVVRR